MRTNALETDFSDILPEEVEEAVKKAAEISMGTEIADTDIDNIRHLCEQVTREAVWWREGRDRMQGEARGPYDGPHRGHIGVWASRRDC